MIENKKLYTWQDLQDLTGLDYRRLRKILFSEFTEEQIKFTTPRKTFFTPKEYDCIKKYFE